MPTRAFDAAYKVRKESEEYLQRLLPIFGWTLQRLYGDEAKEGQLDYRLHTPAFGYQTVTLVVDDRTQETGNIYVETRDSAQAGTPGWAYRSQADAVLVCANRFGIFLMDLATVREGVPHWLWVYYEGEARNETFAGRGVPVPVQDFRRHCRATLPWLSV